MIRRCILAVSSVVLLITAGILVMWWPSAELALAFCWRAGAVLGACSIAFDDIQRLPNWILVTLPALLIVLIEWPRYFIMLAPVLVLVVALYKTQPKKRK